VAPLGEPAMRELWAFLKSRKKWWLVSFLVALLLLALLMIFVEGSDTGPMVYSLF